PSCLNGRREIGTEDLSQSPQQRGADWLEVLGGNPIGDVAISQVPDCRGDLVEFMEVGDNSGEHGHQFLLLRDEVVPKQRTYFRRNLEQAVVEQVGGDAGNR